MHAQAAVPVGLAPAPRPVLVGLYALILVPVVGLVLLVVAERLLRRQLVREGRHMGALEVKSHARGALILGVVWSVAFLTRAWLLELVLLLR